MRIVQLTAESFKRLRAVDITPAGDLVVLSGANAQGKSSVLDAIWAAVGGGRAQPDDPIHHGADQARVTVDLGEIVVERTWTKDGKTHLAVKAASGAKISSPQGVLDKLVGKLSFDPLKFANADAKAQLAALLEVVDLPLDLDALAGQRKALYDQRTDAGRELKSQQARLAAIPAVPGDTPNDEVDVAELAQRISALDTNMAKLATLRQRYDALMAEISSVSKEAGQILAALPVVLRTQHEHGSVPMPPEEVFAAWQAQLTGSKAINEAVRNRKAKVQGQADVRVAERKVEELTGAIGKLDAHKAAVISGAAMPVPGLSFTEDGVTFNGVPFSQASSAERIKVSVAIAMAANPQLRVIHIEDGSLLDSASAQAIAQMAREHDCQVWVEKVDETGQIGIVIEDGMVANV